VIAGLLRSEDLAKTKYYVVWVGRQPGIYASWAECAEQVNGFSGAKYKAYDYAVAAQEAFTLGWEKCIGTMASLSLPPEVIADSISVDAACDDRPGNLEYRGVHTQSGEEIFHVGPIENGTNNLGEFLAIVHALALLKQQGRATPIYSDSRTAIKWVKQKHVRSRLPRQRDTETVWTLVDRAQSWLENNWYANEILEWDTRQWGEIRADFGRK
jgi:ribonuclease HI